MGTFEIQHDEVAEKLDELADLAEAWKKHRDKGGNPYAIRNAMLMVMGELHAMDMFEKFQMSMNASSDPVDMPVFRPKPNEDGLLVMDDPINFRGLDVYLTSRADRLIDYYIGNARRLKVSGLRESSMVSENFASGVYAMWKDCVIDEHSPSSQSLIEKYEKR